jgi:hypothetical protein
MSPAPDGKREPLSEAPTDQRRDLMSGTGQPCIAEYGWHMPVAAPQASLTPG